MGLLSLTRPLLELPPGATRLEKGWGALPTALTDTAPVWSTATSRQLSPLKASLVTLSDTFLRTTPRQHRVRGAETVLWRARWRSLGGCRFRLMLQKMKTAFMLFNISRQNGRMAEWQNGRMVGEFHSKKCNPTVFSCNESRRHTTNSQGPAALPGGCIPQLQQLVLPSRSHPPAVRTESQRPHCSTVIGRRSLICQLQRGPAPVHTSPHQSTPVWNLPGIFPPCLPALCPRVQDSSTTSMRRIHHSTHTLMSK